MEKETISKIEEEINQKITLPNNIKEKVKKDVFTNIIIAILMIIYFTFLIVGSKETIKIFNSDYINAFSISLLGVSICLFEIAYKKDNISIALYGIEILLISIITLFFPYIIFELDESHNKNYMVVSAYIAVYYVMKAIWIVSKTKKMHIKQTSDIKEIVRKEKRKDVIRAKTKAVEVAAHNDSQIQEEQKPKKRGRPPKNVGGALQGSPKPNKKEKTKKIVEEKTVKTKTQKTEEKENVEVSPKKRGRPKKTETINNENKNNVGGDAHNGPKTNEEQKPKKRGRPRKVVTVDD